MKNDHVVCLDASHPDSKPGLTTIRCEHCGARVDLGLPISVDEFCAVCGDFSKRHRLCPPRPRVEAAG